VPQSRWRRILQALRGVEIERIVLLRLGALIAVIAFLVLFTKVASMGTGHDKKRFEALERHAVEAGQPPAKPAAP
jgi:hypothetical protein